MLTIGGLAFAAPWLLLGLAALPAIWWLLRLLPPRPRTVRFPAVRLLFGLRQEERTSERTPIRMLLLRIAIAALAVIAAAEPVLAPGNLLTGSGPVLIAIDDGWASAPNWPALREAALGTVEEAGRTGRTVRLLTLAPDAAGAHPAIGDAMPPETAAAALAELEPKPWPPDRGAAADALDGFGTAETAAVVWVADGLDHGSADRFARSLRRLGPVDVIRPAIGDRAHLLRPASREPTGVGVAVERAGGPAATVLVDALDGNGRRLATAELVFAADERRAEGRIGSPGELLNRTGRFQIRDSQGAGSVVLVSDGWRRRKVGLAAQAGGTAGHPLLDDLHYLRSALAPFADVVEAPVPDLLDADVDVLALTDATELGDGMRDALAAWLEAGGVLLRFAGPRLAEAGGELLPVAVRRGERQLGGALSWSRPQRFGAFPETGPFAGLTPSGDVSVARQVLAEPAPDLPDRTWALLEDGVAIVTGARSGTGWTVLVHTSANADWSDLALSGLYPLMLKRLVELGGTDAGPLSGRLEPARVLDGYGRLTEPGSAVLPIDGGRLDATLPGPSAPPGLYGRAGVRHAFNLGAAAAGPTLLGGLPDGVGERPPTSLRERPLRPFALLLCLLLLLVDGIAALGYRGYRLRIAALAACALPLALVPGAPAADDDRDAAAEVRLAYVVTGDVSIDATSRAGLLGLSRVLGTRTSVEPGEPAAVDIERDELAFFPVLYWPMAPGRDDPSDSAHARLARYVALGGMLVLDTRDHGAVAGRFDLRGRTTTPERARLRRLLAGLRAPPLGPVAPDHVLTRAFYLLRDFPGRHAGGTVWVERRASVLNDRVPGYVIGPHDWAAAWAEDRFGRPMHAVFPGGERQREMAFRFGVNLVMHALTGNYKADQVHVPAVLERLGE